MSVLYTSLKRGLCKIFVCDAPVPLCPAEAEALHSHSASDRELSSPCSSFDCARRTTHFFLKNCAFLSFSTFFNTITKSHWSCSACSLSLLSFLPLLWNFQPRLQRMTWLKSTLDLVSSMTGLSMEIVCSYPFRNCLLIAWLDDNLTEGDAM